MMKMMKMLGMMLIDKQRKVERIIKRMMEV
jgi:hypothetical protein